MAPKKAPQAKVLVPRIQALQISAEPNFSTASPKVRRSGENLQHGTIMKGRWETGLVPLQHGEQERDESAQGGTYGICGIPLQ